MCAAIGLGNVNQPPKLSEITDKDGPSWRNAPPRKVYSSNRRRRSYGISVNQMNIFQLAKLARRGYAQEAQKELKFRVEVLGTFERERLLSRRRSLESGGFAQGERKFLSDCHYGNMNRAAYNKLPTA